MVRKRLMALAALTLVACGGTSLVDVPNGVTFRVEQTRSGLMSRAIQMQVVNAGSRTLTVTRIEFSSKRFDKTVVWTGPSDVEAGVTKNLRVDMPVARCGKGIDATMRLTYVVDGGKEVETEVSPSDRYGSVGSLMKRDCAERSLARVARLTVAPELEVTGEGGDSVIHADVTLTPTGAKDDVALTSIDSTVMMKFAPGFDGKIGKSAAAPLHLDIPLVPTRCDAHVVAEDKAGTLFPIHIVSKASGKAFFYLPLTEAQRAQVFDYLADHCGFGTS